MSQLSVNITKAHAVRTDATYNSGLRAWFAFCHYGALPNLLSREAVPDPLEAELIVMMFAQHLFNGGTVSAKKTIPVYLAAVRDYHVKRTGIMPWKDALRLPLFLKSLARLDKRRVQKRAPVTLRILRLWRPLFDLRRRQHLIWWTAMVVAFMGLFRKSEFCLLDGMCFDCLRNLCRGDASFQRVVVNGAVVSMELHVKFYKNEQHGTGTLSRSVASAVTTAQWSWSWHCWRLSRSCPPRPPCSPAALTIRTRCGPRSLPSSLPASSHPHRSCRGLSCCRTPFALAARWRSTRPAHPTRSS